MSRSVPQLYGDLMSQPTRAVYWFCLLNDIKFQFMPIHITKGEQLKSEFKKINPHGKVPAIDDNGFKVNESHTILRYLKQKYSAQDHWYPSDLNERTKVDEYLDWHHLNTRASAAGLFRLKFLLPMLGKEVPENRIKPAQDQLVKTLEEIDTVFLSSRPYLCGDNISIADLLCFSELKQLDILDFDFSSFPHVKEWQNKLEKLPHFDQVHKILNLVIQKRKAKL
eukprot:TRINITY_DN1086_c0_g3_i1.p1 TRINITY_DN1086_c0_g3~~TRINITY_DN1086_c0_g3_i1.p1  ORF type:complete len:224 (+),score=27.92 TRINITY_DN1086_c0_g3_i1:122-793(+)